jgi:hypothetical protein
MSRFADVAKKNQKAGCPQMEDREKVNIEDIITDYPDGILITAVGIITVDNEDIAVFNFEEDPKAFFFGGKVLTDLAKDWISDIGKGDIQATNEEMTKDGGCVLKLSRKKNKKGQTYTAYEVIE